MKKLSLIAICLALFLFIMSSCEEDAVNTNLTDNSNIEDDFLPTVPPPPGGWTAEEQQLISDFGGIDEVAPSNEFISGLKVVAKFEIEEGDKNRNCAGSVGWCDFYFAGWSVGWTNNSDWDVGVEIKIVNNVPIIQVGESDFDGDGEDDPYPGKTTNGLLPIEGFIELSASGCDSLGLSVFIIEPGLYVVDSTGYIYMNASVIQE